MSYAAALSKAWEDVRGLSGPDRLSVRLLGDTYEVEPREGRIRRVPDDAPVKEYAAILILHYLAGMARGGYTPGGAWVSFKEVEGGEFYYPAFREGAIIPLLRKFGGDLGGLTRARERIAVTPAAAGDAGIEVEVFDGVRVRVVMWRGDDEFGPEATILFDRDLTRLFSMEDIAVLLRIVAHAL